MLLDDTIAAVASAPGGALRGIVRISGPKALECVRMLFQEADGAELGHRARAAVLGGSLRLPAFAAPLPCEAHIWPGTRSYTGAPVVELHTIGSPPVLQAVVQGLCAAGARPAEPGEFTLRAFLAGKLDLTQAEAVLGVIDAASPAQLDVALAQLAGGLARPLHALRESLLDLLADLEAGLDFVDEDIQFLSPDELARRLAEAEGEVEQLIRQMGGRTDAREDPRIALVGWPNVGKSSLFNALAGSTALVSNVPGTTRDYLTAALEIDGVRCQLIDTAGFEIVGSAHSIAGAAQRMTSDQRERATLAVLCLDQTRPLRDDERVELASHDHPLLAITKVDQPRHPLFSLPTDVVRSGQIVQTSSTTGEGLDPLRQSIRQFAADQLGGGAVVSGTAVRCHESLRLAAESLARGRAILEEDGGEELVAAEIRTSLTELGKVAGAVYTDDVLDRIFSRFCIGK